MTPFFVLNAAAPGAMPSAPDLPIPSGTRHLRVLVAEDDPTNRLVTTRMLQRMGHLVDTAVHGSEAVRKLQASQCDLVLMDMLMPVLDGIAATRLIRALPPPLGSVPIVGLTGNAEPEHERSCIEAGMNGFITKPVTTRRLTAAISAVTQAGPLPPPPDAEPQLPLLDEPFLHRLAQEIGADSTVEAMEMFLEDAPERLTAMRRALDASANGALRREAHALSGSAANVGLARLGEAASGLQRALESAEDPGSGAIERLFQLLVDSMARGMEWKMRQCELRTEGIAASP
jgi:two-component system, sensor histidine kinase and response regulator